MSDCSHTGVEQIPKKKSAQKVKCGEEFCIYFFLGMKRVTLHGHQFTYTELGMKGQIPEKVAKKWACPPHFFFTWMYKGKVFIHMEV